MPYTFDIFIAIKKKNALYVGEYLRVYWCNFLNT